MKKIIVPTDFSPAAENAFQFAQQLAIVQGGSLKVIHAFHPEVDPAYPYVFSGVSGLVTPLEERLKQFAQPPTFSEEGQSTATQLEIENEVILGFAADEIIRISKAPETDLIVMGTTGAGDLLNRLFGSISSSVAQKAYCPTLLIPKEVQYKGFKKIAFASNHQAADEALLYQFLDFANLYDAEVHFIHVEEQEDVEYEVKNVTFEQIIRRKKPVQGFQVVTIDSTKVVNGLNNYIKENDIDLLVMATTHRNFIENLFHKSMTRKMALNSEVPLLVMHYDDKAI